MTKKWMCCNWTAVLLFCLVASILSPAQEFKTLVNFDGVNGSSPSGPLVQGVDGNLYGATGGSGGSSGTIFKLTSAGALTTLSLIVGEPVGGLVQARDGNFYGITRGGGTNNQGTVFGITPTGKLEPSTVSVSRPTALTASPRRVCYWGRMETSTGLRSAAVQMAKARFSSLALLA
jgi:uncharacterized repeat protein (TIGR03803 family)